MKKSTIAILVVVIIAIVAVIFVFANNNNTQTTNSNVSKENTEATEKISKATIYVYEKESSYIPYEVEYDENLSTIEQAQFLIKEIGDFIGYSIIVNDISNGKGCMAIDFSKNSAPFNDIDTHIGNEKMFIYDRESLIYTIFNSIKETLQKHFGENMDVWYTVDSEEIKFDAFNITIDLEQPFTELKKANS